MDLADRMKQYEAAFDTKLPTSTPIILRLDGHNFSRSTSPPHFEQLFDQHIHDALISTCSDLLIDYFPRATVAYTHFDEITLVFPEGGVQLFDERIQKLASLAASYCSVRFNAHLAATSSSGSGNQAYFDAHFLTVPNIEEALNYLIWRCRGDVLGNGIGALARTMFSQDQIYGKTSAELVYMMQQEKNVAVPEWAVKGCLVKPELYQHERQNPTTGQMEMTTETRARVGNRGIKEISMENSRLVTEKYWKDINASQLPKPIIVPVADASSITTANTTFLGPNVYVFDPRMPAADIQAKATAIFKQMEANEFGNERYALLFKPAPTMSSSTLVSTPRSRGWARVRMTY